MMAGKASKKFDLGELGKALAGPVSESDTMQEIRLNDIWANKRNIYPELDAAAMAELVSSIEANGLIEPPTVVPVGDGAHYRLISGHNRIAAIRKLLANDPACGDSKWNTVLCRVLPPMSEEQEMTAVIEANRQRVKTPALLAREAEVLTQMYIKRKEAGEVLPGRIRDRVAEVLQVNATKLANLSAIKNGIKVPGIMKRWEDGDLSELAALEIARMDHDEQYRLLDWMIDKGMQWSVNNVRMFRTVWSFCRHDCPEVGGFCGNAQRMYNSHYYHGEWLCLGCCMACLKRDTCTTACEHARPTGQGIAPPPQKVVRNPVCKDPRLDYKVMTPTFCQRVKALREETGLGKKDFAESIGEYPGTYSAWENASMAGSGTVPKLALALGCTTDYLYGLTDDPRPAASQQEGQMVLAAWMPGALTPPEPCDVVADLQLADLMQIRKLLHWDGSAFLFRRGGEKVEVDVIRWLRLPETEEEND